MVRSFITALFLFSVCHANAQQAEDSVRNTIEKMFTAMKASDGNAFSNCFADSAIMQTVKINSNGKAEIETATVKDFAILVSKSAKGLLDERIKIDMVKTDGALAIAWVPYSFYYNGNFSHCGVNSFQLVRLAGEWRIAYIIDTRRRSNCL